MARSSSPGDGMFDVQAALEPADPQAGMVEIDLIAAYADRFAHAQAVSEHHPDQEMISDAMPALLHGVEERGDLRRAQEVFGALVAVGGLSTFDISPFGRAWRAHRNPSSLRASGSVTFYKKRVLSNVHATCAPRSSRSSRFKSKVPYGLTCAYTSGLNARISASAMRPNQTGSSSTRCNIKVLT
jgi:hypothetical protein